MSDTESDLHPRGPTYTTPTTTTAERALARDKKKRKEKEAEQKQEVEQQLRMEIERLRQQIDADQVIMNGLAQQVQQNKQMKQEPTADVEDKHTNVSVSGNANVKMVVSSPHEDSSEEEEGEIMDSDEDDDENNISRQSKKKVVAKKGNTKSIVLPRIPKSLQTFGGEGGSSVRNWLQQFEATRIPLGWDDRVSIAICAMHLTDRAQQWYQEEGQHGTAASSWVRFKKALLTRFTPTINQLFIPKYTRDLAQRTNEKSVDFLDRVRVELRDLGVDDEAQVVRVFSSGLHDWITEPLTMLVGDSHQISAKDLLNHCTRIELSKSIRHGNHFDNYKRGGNVNNININYQKPRPQPNTRYNGPIQGYPKAGGMVTSNEKLQLTPKDQCKLCGSKGHWARECPKRQGGGMKPDGVNVAVNVGNNKTCSHCGKNGHLVDDCYTLKNEMKRKEQAYPRGGNGGVPPGRVAIRTIQMDDAIKAVRTVELAVNAVDGKKAIQRYGVFSVWCTIGEASVYATLDSGADQVSCISEDTYNYYKFGNKNVVQVTPITASHGLVSAGGNSLDCIGTVVLPIRMVSADGYKQMEVCFHVVKTLNVNCLLGSNFFLTCGSSLDWSDLSNPFLTLWNGDKVFIDVRRGGLVHTHVDTGIQHVSDQQRTAMHQERINSGNTTEAERAVSLQSIEKMKRASHQERRESIPLNKLRDERHKKRKQWLKELEISKRSRPLPQDDVSGVHAIRSIRLVSNVYLPANSVTAMPHARVYCSKDVKEGSFLMAHGNEKLYEDGIMVAHSAHQVSSGKDVKLVLQMSNTNPYAVTYRRGQIIGATEEVDIMSIKEKEEIQQSADMHKEILSQIREKIEEKSNDSAVSSGDDQALIMQTLSQFTHVFDDRYMGEARQQGESVQHVINTGSAPPRRSHPYRQSPAMEEIVKTEIDKQLELGVVKHSNSPWASPIVMVKKKDGSWRMCVDYRGLNALTVPDVYPLPAIDQLLYSMRDAKVFTTMDLQSAYNQIAVSEVDRPKTAFIHRSGLYEYTRMPFGLRNAPSTFQRFMNMIMGTGDAAMQIYVMVYLDDVVIFSATISDHCVHLHQVLAIISRHGLKLKLSKCEFGRNRIHYLGHVLDANGVHVDPAKVAAVADMPLPTKALELQSFLGMCGYYRRFIDKYSTIAQPLHNLLRQDVTWKWEQVHTQACEKLKQALISAPVLVMPDYSKPFIVQTDASGVGVGAVLCQLREVNGKMVEKPIAYVSRGLKRHERNYSVTHLELLAVIWSLKQFRHYVLGKKFLLQTDHIALESIRKTKELSGRMARWILQLQEYEFDVQYRRGRENANADALSRLPLNTDTDDIINSMNSLSIRSIGIVERQLMDEQQLDSTFGPVYQMVLDKEENKGTENRETEVLIPGSNIKVNLIQFVLISHVLYHIHMMNNRTHIEQSVLQICLPKSMVPDILHEMHDTPFSGHLSTAKTYGRILHRYFWLGMYEDVKNYCESCVVCARRKTPHRQGNIPMLSPQADRLTVYGPCECVALDTIGPITMSHGQTTVILTMVDLYTRVGRAVAMRKQKTKNIAEAFLVHWVCVYGFPRTIVSDNGPGFASSVMRAAMAMVGVKIHYTLPYHPESNGACERLNATIINMLSSYTQDTQSEWASYLPFIVFAYNTSVHSSTGFSPYRLLHGREAVIGSESWLGSATASTDNVESYPKYIQKIQHDMATSHQLIEQRVSQVADERSKMNEQYRSIVEYKIGEEVYVYWPPRSSKKDRVTAKLLSPYRGPFTVTHQFNSVSYRVKENSTGKHVSVHVSRMKKAVERDTSLMHQDNTEHGMEHKHDTGSSQLTIVNDELMINGDAGVHEHTRSRRQQRQHLQQQQQNNEPVEEEELEEGEVPRQ